MSSISSTEEAVVPLGTVVTISYQDLLVFCTSNDSDNNNDNDTDKNISVIRKRLIDRVGEAFGSSPHCLGLIAVEGIPNFVELRQGLLPLGHKLVNAPDLDECVHPKSFWSVGWSHGKEQLGQGQPDLCKGSYYGNPLTDDLVQSLMEREPDKTEYWKQQLKEKPECYAANVWPKSLPAFPQAFTRLGKLMQETGVMLAAVCDAYCKQTNNNNNGVDLGLEQTLRTSLNAKGRLLHYFAASSDATSNDQWCAMHNDHGSLTALAPGMYLDANGNQVDNPDPDHSGLYIQARSGTTYRVQLPSTACGFQIGETSQIQSGGILQATPHAVVAPRPQQCTASSSSTFITRESFALFLEPEFEVPLNVPLGKTVEDCQDAESKLPSSILPLQQRWKPGYSFGDFHTATVSGFATATSTSISG